MSLRMAEGSNVRLVRCPKCENLLPELPDFSVYKCGGCGAVLRASNLGAVNDSLSKKSDNKRVSNGYEKDGVNFGGVSETERQSDELEIRTREGIFQERVDNLNGGNSSIAGNKEVLLDCDRTRGGETMGVRPDQTVNVRSYDDDEYRRPSKVSIDNRVRTNENDISMGRPEFFDSFVEREFEETKPPIGSLRSRGYDSDLNLNKPQYVNSSAEHGVEEVRVPIGSLRSRPNMDQWSLGRNGSTTSRGNIGGVAGHGRFASFSYPDHEGPSNFHPGSFYGYGSQLRDHEVLARPARVEDLENDRAELLRKLDELKDQLGRSCDLAEKRKERMVPDRTMVPPRPPYDPYNGHGAYIPEASTNLYRVDMQPLARDKNVPNPYFNQNGGSLPYTERHGLDMQDFYAPSRNIPNEYMGHEDAYRPQMLRRPPPQPPHQYLQYLQGPYRDHFPARHADFNQDALMSHTHETFFHQPACSCLHCYNRKQQIPPKVPPPAFSRQRLCNDINEPIYYRGVNHAAYGPHGYTSECSYPPQLPTRDRQHLTRSSSGLDSDNDRPRRVLFARGTEQIRHPIAGGAPFIACCNCFKLLKLPRKLMVVGKNQRKTRCGACSSVILCEFENKGLVVSVPEQNKQVSANADDESNELLNGNLQRSNDCLNAGATKSCSNKYGNFGYNFQLTTQPNLLSGEQRSNSESEKMQGPHSSSLSFTEDEMSPERVIGQRNVSNSVELPSAEDVALPIPDSPLQEQPDSSSSNSVVSAYEKIKSKCLHNDQENVLFDSPTSRQNYVKVAPVATETEVSVNDFLNSGVSQDSLEMKKEDDQPRINKGGAFLVGLIKKGFRDFSRSSRSNENGKSNIFVNGELLPDRIVKKAEKIAGPIQPGDYWYDYQAGFWGVMGRPCFGIIPPFIEEFNYPMPLNCAAGNTSVFVNGRELHQKDLDLLVDRGLPITKHKSYLIEISGRVLDEHTGEELDSLGKLAPTVERARHGFGMKVPGEVA